MRPAGRPSPSAIYRSAPGTRTRATNWGGVGYGIVEGFVAAYFQFKVPPALRDGYRYDTFVAGGFTSTFAVAAMAISVRVGRGIRRAGAPRCLAAAFAPMIAGSALGLAAPESGRVVRLSRAVEGLAGPLLAVAIFRLPGERLTVAFSFGAVAGFSPPRRFIGTRLRGAPPAAARSAQGTSR